MKNMKKNLSLLLTLALVLSLFTGLTLTAHADDSLFWIEVLSDGTLSVYVNHETHQSDTSVTVPAYIDGTPVTTIASCCFCEMPNLSSVTLPEGITTIGGAAFMDCPNLKSITLPASVTTANAQTFEMSSLEAISVSPASSSFASVDGVLFSKDKKTLVAYPDAKAGSRYRVPDGVTEIASSAFFDSSLAQITLPDTLKTIRDNAFDCCRKLTALNIPDSVTALEENAVSWCESLTELTLPAGLTEIPAYAFSGCHSLEELEIPAAVTSIGDEAFGGCWNLKTLSLPDALTQLGSRVFYDCVSLDRITLPKDLAHLGTGALCGLSRIEVSPDNIRFCSVDGILFSKDQTVLVQYPGGSTAAYYTVPEGVIELADGTFENAYSLQHVTLPDTISKLGVEVFAQSGLTEIALPEGIAEIPDLAFSWCDSLAKVTLPDTVTRIGNEAFSGCAFSAFTVPDAVTEIAFDAFSGCENMETIQMPKEMTSIGSYAFRGCTRLKSIEIPYGISTIWDDTFSECSALSSVSIPATVNDIRGYAFYECSGLSKIVFGGTKDSWEKLRPDDGSDFGNEALDRAAVECIGETHADDCFLCICEPGHDELLLYALTDKAKGMTSLTVPAQIDGIPIRRINSNAFANCSWLSTVRIPEGVEAIGPYAFRECGSLNDVVLPSSLRQIGEHAFEACFSLQSIALPDGLTELGDGAFIFCSGLERIRIPAGITQLEAEVFYDCYSLRDVSLPESLTVIGPYAFADCCNLSEIDLPADLKLIEQHAFWLCTGLHSLCLPEGLETLTDDVFTECTGLKWIYIPDSVQSIGCDLFGGVESITDVYYEGSEAQWNGISIDAQNSKLNRTVIHCNSVPAVGDFLDVHENDWFRDSVAYAYEKGLMNGTGDYVFSPNASLTRAQLVTILYRMEGSPEVSFRGTFPDVAPGLWYSDAIEWAAANGIVNGYTDGTFGPNAEITREQIATILYRLDGSPEATGTLPFPDAASVGGYAVDAMRWAVSEGLINGVSSGGVTSLAPKNTATRAQIAAIIQRYQEAKA